MRTPSSTYRLQFNHAFRLTDALSILDYLNKLGISDVYASPLFTARRGSMHGYDVANPNEINSEIGSSEELSEFSQALTVRDMGLLLDIVPNHMVASIENPWWLDVLAKGEASPFASFFDVNWDSGRVLLPILRRPYGETLESGELLVKQDNGKAVLQYFGLELPLDVRGDVDFGALNGRKGDPRSFDALDQILSSQRFRLAYWRKAAESINYRRFFDISDLVGVRAEDPEVFNAIHRKTLQLVAEGVVSGLRIDHIDGLLDPKTYLDRLPDIYSVVEKILAGSERLPRDWRTQGTTGYDFLNIVNGLFIHPEGYVRLREIYAAHTGHNKAAEEIYRSKKRLVLRELFAGEAEKLTQRLAALAEEDRYAKDLLGDDLRSALLELTACLPVYRTYVREGVVSEADRSVIEFAIAHAAVSQNRGALDFIRRVLLVESPLERVCEAWRQFAMSWQQFTGPVMAKGLEDTTFYIHNPLTSVNEVGGNPDGPEAYFGVDEFHGRNMERGELWPNTMNASSTHDTKRSEDVRARIDVLSEIPDEWADALRHWSRWTPSENAPDRNEQVFIYQTLLGAWPINQTRMHQYIVKALRESKTHSSWLHSDEEYENNVLGFIDRLMDPEKSRRFLSDFLRLQKKVAFYGALNSLSQVLLKMMCPGVPDFYQGTELWDFSLADPDNRRPVDYRARVNALQSLAEKDPAGKLLKTWKDGRIKMFVIHTALKLRKVWPEVFSGRYIPVPTTGNRAVNVAAFVRRHEDRWVFVAVPRWTTQMVKTGQMPIGGSVWQDTRFELPDGGPADWQNHFTGELVNGPLTAAAAFESYPLALLTSYP